MKRYGSAGALALVVVGFVLRVRGLSEYWLNPDEGIDYGILTAGSFGDFWTGVIANAHPPLYYLVLRGAGFLTWDFVWLRGTSLLFGTAAIWLFWLLGRELGGAGKGGYRVGSRRGRPARGERGSDYPLAGAQAVRARRFPSGGRTPSTVEISV